LTTNDTGVLLTVVPSTTNTFEPLRRPTHDPAGLIGKVISHGDPALNVETKTTWFTAGSVKFAFKLKDEIGQSGLAALLFGV
jgi:hypothetical protein